MNSDTARSSLTDDDSFGHSTLKAPGRPAKRRQVSLASKARARRNLFGPVDHETTDDFLRKELAILSDLSNRRWNFDFVNEIPMSGRWKWEVVRSGDRSVPPAYGSMVRDGRAENVNPRRNPLVPVVAAGHNRLQDLSNIGAPSSSSTCDKSSATTNLKQSSLKGFLSVRKRKSKSNAKMSNKSRVIRCTRNSTAKSLPAHNPGSSLSNISQGEVAE